MWSYGEMHEYICEEIIPSAFPRGNEDSIALIRFDLVRSD